MITEKHVYVPHGVMDCWWYREEIPCCVYFHLLFHAAYCDSVQYGIPVKNGQVVTTYAAIARRWHYKDEDIKKAVRRLRKSGDILEVKRAGHYLLFTINQHDEMMQDALDKHFGRTSNQSENQHSNRYIQNRPKRKTSAYSELIKSPLWQKKRLKILNRDSFQCVRCGNKAMSLHVHHLYYEKGKKPWEYPDDALITLCEECHKKEHGKRCEV